MCGLQGVQALKKHLPSDVGRRGPHGASISPMGNSIGVAPTFDGTTGVWTTPALVGEDGGLIAGHARILAARQLGISEIPVMVAAGWSEAQKRAYVLADNQLAISGSGWDPELLRLELGELKLGGFDLSLTGFGDLELKDLLAERTGGLTDPDDAPAAPEHPVSQTGDLWVLGRHRILCGDSTVATDVERVLGGVEPHLMVTDPPYGVNYDPAHSRARTCGGTAIPRFLAALELTIRRIFAKPSTGRFAGFAPLRIFPM